MTNTNTIKITTPAGRTIAFSRAAAEVIQETGISGQIDTDIDNLVRGDDAAGLLAACQDGADDDRMVGWSDYVDAIVDAAAGLARGR